MRSCFAFLLAAPSLLLAGCGESTRCTPGRSVSCTCAGGATGVQVCKEDKTYEACSCEPNPEADGIVVVTPGKKDSGLPAGAKRFFITSAAYKGDLKTLGGGATGLAGGDALCTNSARAANLGGSWKAWLSDTSSAAIDRIAEVGAWYLVDGRKVFNNKANLTTTPLVPPHIDEQGKSQGGAVWTGTESAGLPAFTDCDGWTKAFSTLGRVGDPLSESRWTSASSQSCEQVAHLYCLEQ